MKSNDIITSISSNSHNTQEMEHLLKSFDILFFLYSLRIGTDKEHAFSIPEIASFMNQLFSCDSSRDEVFNLRTIRRLVESFSELCISKNELSPYIRSLLAQVIGGEVKSRDANPKKNNKQKERKSQQVYYFSPLLSTDDSKLLSGLVQSSELLSKEEKDYLLGRLGAWNPTFDPSVSNDPRYHSIPKNNSIVSRRPNKSESICFYYMIASLYDAITHEQKIHLVFKNDIFVSNDMISDGFIVNPYALIRHEGIFYLVCTKDQETAPFHIRLDSVLLAEAIKPDPSNHEISKRASIPNSLYRFFNAAGTEFHTVRYLAAYPELNVSNSHKKVTLKLDCNILGLRLLSDSFGKEQLRITEPVNSNPSNRKQFSQNDNYHVKVSNIQYDNALQFCSKHHAELTVTAPADFISDLKSALQKSLAKYE